MHRMSDNFLHFVYTHNADAVRMPIQCEECPLREDGHCTALLGDMPLYPRHSARASQDG